MTKGLKEEAERIALNEFDQWNDSTGFVQKHTGYYYELQAGILDAVHIGIQMAIHGKILRDEDGSIKHEE